ncbi:MAG: hypothetical protein NVSMB29_04700 [Candidatus Dormibacteria bacterium]
MVHTRVATAALMAITLGVGLSACGSSSQSQATPAGNKSSSFCVRIGGVVAQFSQMFASTGSGPTPDLNAYKRQFASLASAIDSLDGQAPSEIASAIHTERVAFDQASERAQKATAPDEVFVSLDDPSIKAADDQITQYMSAKCGITPGGSVPSPSDK